MLEEEILDLTPAIPHQIDPENGGTILGSSYGDGVKITRLEGSGSGKNTLEIDSVTIVDILEQW